MISAVSLGAAAVGSMLPFDCEIAGKVTVLSILVGLHRLDSGAAVVDGISVVGGPHEVCSRPGLHGQLVSVSFILTGREYLIMIRRFSGYSRRGACRPADEVLERFGLGGADLRVVIYPGGMRSLDLDGFLLATQLDGAVISWFCTLPTSRVLPMAKGLTCDIAIGAEGLIVMAVIGWHIGNPEDLDFTGCLLALLSGYATFSIGAVFVWITSSLHPTRTFVTTARLSICLTCSALVLSRLSAASVRAVDNWGVLARSPDVCFGNSASVNGHASLPCSWASPLPLSSSPTRLAIPVPKAVFRHRTSGGT